MRRETVRPFRFIQVGCGARAEMWDRVIFRNGDRLTTVAYVNRTIEKAKRFSDYHPELHIPCFSDLDETLRDVDADAVLLVTPPDVHREQIETIAKYGLPILAEKPLAVTLNEAISSMEVVDAAGIPLSVSCQFRYLPVSREIRRLCETKELGEPGFGFFGYFRNRDGMRPDLNKYPLTMEHPMLLEQTIHHLDLIRYCYGSEPVWIDTVTWNPKWSMYAHDSNVMSMMEMENGMMVSYFGTWTSGYNGPPEIMFNWRTDCSEGVIIQEQVFEDLWKARMNDGEIKNCNLPTFTAFLDDTELLLLEFVDAVRSGAPVPCSGWDHVRSLAMAFASIESAASGRRVYMREFLQRYEVR
jgi:predicted dehydrogenase